MQDQKK